MHRLPLVPLSLALLVLVLPAGPAGALDCRRQAEEELTRLGLNAAADVSSIRYVQKYNPSGNGPEVLGVRAWVRPKTCGGGYLVVDMTRSCFVRQSYTRGECRLDGVTAY